MLMTFPTFIQYIGHQITKLGTKKLKLLVLSSTPKSTFFYKLCFLHEFDT